ncbi:MAG: OmpA family protein [Bacteroidetes bacterium]|nr:OmpA family protein [Bacteroidota bacterium]
MNSSYTSLNKLVEILKKRGKFKLTVSGHTDNKGSAALNNALSLKRANAVKRYLSSKGINSSMIITEGNGSNFPVADNATEEGRQKNRRVEFKLE